MIYRKLSLLPTLALILSLGTPQVSACGFHSSFEEDANIPRGATWLVIRSYSAVQQGRVPAIEKLEGDAGFRRASWWLNLFTREFQKHGVEESYIYLADVALWAKYQHQAPTRLQLELAPEQQDYNVVVLTSETLGALVSEEITLSRAKELGIISVSEGAVG
ncbi:hypothetical protein [Vibrio sp. WXL210]|uniref:hypothetical protein n=1 Tax=Vibrio sp. WXL210 TaxID=3450709 RepID=UPI003EC67A05